VVKLSEVGGGLALVGRLECEALPGYGPMGDHSWAP